MPSGEREGVLQMRLTPEEGLTLASLMQTGEPLHPGLGTFGWSKKQVITSVSCYIIPTILFQAHFAGKCRENKVASDYGSQSFRKNLRESVAEGSDEALQSLWGDIRGLAT